MRSDLVPYSHRNDKMALIDCKRKCQTWCTEWVSQAILQNILGFKNLYACGYILFLIL